MSRPDSLHLPLVIALVGLPARGKSFTGRKLARYLGWSGYRTRVFNVGAYRRARFGAQQPHQFFNPDNPEGQAARERVAIDALDDMLGFLASEGDIGIYDATNSTRDRRRTVSERCALAGARLVFVETLCDDPAIIEANVRETKLSNPDYRGLEPDAAVADFRARIAHYERIYETVDEEAYSFVKLHDVGRQVVVNRMRGTLEGRLVSFLMNLHITPRTIWLTRHGQSVYNTRGLLGGDSPLSRAGIGYADALRCFVRARDPAVIWTSTLQRTIQTGRATGRGCLQIKALDEIDAGICDGMTYAQIADRFPSVADARAADKLRYRYPQGESYEDVIRRLDPVIMDLERSQEPVMVIAHQAVLRALYAYLVGQAREDCPHLSIPLHTVIELRPTAYGCDEERFQLAPQPLDDAQN